MIVEQVEADFKREKDRSKQDELVVSKEKSYVRFLQLDEDEDLSVLDD